MNCLNCNKELPANHGYKYKKLCNNKCAGEWYYKKKKQFAKTCIVCNELFLGSENQKCCSNECGQEYGKLVSKSLAIHSETQVCNYCKKTFFIRVNHRGRKAKNKEYYCTVECYQQNQQDKKEYRKAHQKTNKCLRCGVETTNTRYCSNKCSKTGERVERLIRLCQECGKEFRCTVAETKQRAFLYCSYKCAMTHRQKTSFNWAFRIKNKIASSGEVQFMELLNKNKIPYKFNFSVPPYWVDFLLPGNIVVEIDGVICCNKIHNHCKHTKPKEAERNRLLAKLGFTVIRFTDIFVKSKSGERALKTIEQVFQKLNVTYDFNCIEEIKYWTVKQVADYLNISEKQVRQYCNKGVFKDSFRAKSLGAPWYISKEYILQTFVKF